MDITLSIRRQESFSRGELLLRSFFGVFYIFIPHAIALLFVSLWGGILGGLLILPHVVILVFRLYWVLLLNFLAWWAILFTGRFPENWFTWCEEQMRWSTRLNAYLLYMTEEYPPFTGRATA